MGFASGLNPISSCSVECQSYNKTISACPIRVASHYLFRSGGIRHNSTRDRRGGQFAPESRDRSRLPFRRTASFLMSSSRAKAMPNRRFTHRPQIRNGKSASIPRTDFGSPTEFQRARCPALTWFPQSRLRARIASEMGFPGITPPRARITSSPSRDRDQRKAPFFS